MAQPSERESGMIEHVMSYVVACTPWLFFGPKPSNAKDAYYLRVTLGVDVIYNLMPVQEDPIWYMAHYGKEGETNPDMKDGPELSLVGAFPNDNIMDQSQAKQVAFLAGCAMRISNDLAQGKTCYLHHRTGEREEALVAFLLWYLKSPSTSPHLNLSDWIIEHDYKQVLRDDEDNALLLLCVDALKRAAPKNALTSWVVRKKLKE
jgi:hypothetical protein